MGEAIKLATEEDSGLSIKKRYITAIGLVSLAAFTIMIYFSISDIFSPIADRFPTIATLHETVNVVNPDEKLLFVGDVHGNYNELMQLLEDHYGEEIYPSSGSHLKKENNYRMNLPENNTVVLLGDFLVKGPDSSKVADFILANRDKVQCVLGNNEIMVLLGLLNPSHSHRVKNSLHFTTDKKFIVEGGDSNNVDKASLTNVLVPKERHYEMAKEIGFNRLAQLASHCSVVQKFELTQTNETLYGVHAGLLPGDFHVDSSTGQTHIPSITSLVDMKYVNSKDWSETGRDEDDVSNGVRWYSLWDDYYKKSGRSHKNKELVTVLYGHDASNGLTLHKHTKGLDSGCVKGGKLSSLQYVYDKATAKYSTRLRQVKCPDV